MSDRCPPARDAAGTAGWPVWVRRIVLFAVLWWILTGGAADSWLVGVPVVVAAAWLSMTLWSGFQLAPLGVLRFIPWFAWESIVGATDVAVRALQRDMPLYPGVVRHRVRLPPGASRVMLANVVSMLAGTLSADIEGDVLVIHTLDMHKDMHAMVLDLEPRVAAMFGLGLGDAAAAEELV